MGNRAGDKECYSQWRIWPLAVVMIIISLCSLQASVAFAENDAGAKTSGSKNEEMVKDEEATETQEVVRIHAKTAAELVESIQLIREHLDPEMRDYFDKGLPLITEERRALFAGLGRFWIEENGYILLDQLPVEEVIRRGYEEYERDIVAFDNNPASLVQNAVKYCWAMTPLPKTLRSGVIVVELRMNKDLTLTRPPGIVHSILTGPTKDRKKAEMAALLAASRCGPVEGLAIENYKQWQKVQIRLLIPQSRR